MNFSISNYYVYGLERAVKASGNPMRTKIDTSEATDKDFLRAAKLGSCQGGEGHDNYLKGINVQLDVSAPPLLVEGGPEIPLVRIHIIAVDHALPAQVRHRLAMRRRNRSFDNKEDGGIGRRVQRHTR